MDTLVLSNPVFVYAIFLKNNSSKIYIGKTKHLKRRFRRHITGASKCVRLNRALAKYGESAFEFFVIKKCASDEEAFALEQRSIQALRAEGCDLLNLTNGGEGACGRVWDTEGRAKLSEALRGRKLAPEHCERLRTARRTSPYRNMRRGPVREAELWEVVCVKCGTKFERRAREERYRQRTNAAGPFCSLRCRNIAAARSRHGHFGA